VKPVKGQPEHEKREGIFTNNQFGPLQMDTKKEKELCVPSEKFVEQGNSCGNCTTDHGGLGCENLACEATVCALDSFCCDTAWDGLCANEAVEFCVKNNICF
jgi:hypothetical protein